MRVVLARQAGVNPVAHGRFTAHALPHVPEGAAFVPAGIALGFDDVIDAWHNAQRYLMTRPLITRPAVGGADRQNARRGGRLAQASEQSRKHGLVVLVAPV